jgi:hypothetical protein
MCLGLAVFRALSIEQAGSWADLEIPLEERLGVKIHPISSWQRIDRSKFSSD